MGTFSTNVTFDEMSRRPESLVVSLSDQNAACMAMGMDNDLSVLILTILRGF